MNKQKMKNEIISPILYSKNNKMLDAESNFFLYDNNLNSCASKDKNSSNFINTDFLKALNTPQNNYKNYNFPLKIQTPSENHKENRLETDDRHLLTTNNINEISFNADDEKIKSFEQRLVELSKDYKLNLNLEEKITGKNLSTITKLKGLANELIDLIPLEYSFSCSKLLELVFLNFDSIILFYNMNIQQNIILKDKIKINDCEKIENTNKKQIKSKSINYNCKETNENSRNNIIKSSSSNNFFNQVNIISKTIYQAKNSSLANINSESNANSKGKNIIKISKKNNLSLENLKNKIINDIKNSLVQKKDLFNQKCNIKNQQKHFSYISSGRKPLPFQLNKQEEDKIIIEKK